MLRCKKCDAELVGDEQFCHGCGQSLAQKKDSAATLEPVKSKLHTALSPKKLIIIIPSLLVIVLLLFLSLNYFRQPSGDADGAFIYPEGALIVDSTADSGAGTLRRALETAASEDLIVFDPAVFPPRDPATIYLQTELPEVSCGNLTIDASNAGVIIDGSNVFATDDRWTSGLDIASDSNIVMGLQIVNFSPACAISVHSGAKNNIIGGDPNIGSGPFGQGNLIGNVNTGIALQGEGTANNTIKGNTIGFDPTGSKAWTVVGVHVLEGAVNNTIGPGNTIINSDNCGIQIWGSAAQANTITENSIFNNHWLGIELWEGGNARLAAPRIKDLDLGQGIVRGTACPGCIVEIFSDSGGEGEIYEGTTVADDDGNFAFSAGKPLTGPNVTATVTDSEGNTSEFSAPVAGDR